MRAFSEDVGGGTDVGFACFVVRRPPSCLLPRISTRPSRARARGAKDRSPFPFSSLHRRTRQIGTTSRTCGLCQRARAMARSRTRSRESRMTFCPRRSRFRCTISSRRMRPCLLASRLLSSMGFRTLRPLRPHRRKWRLLRRRGRMGSRRVIVARLLGRLLYRKRTRPTRLHLRARRSCRLLFQLSDQVRARCWPRLDMARGHLSGRTLTKVRTITRLPRRWRAHIRR